MGVKIRLEVLRKLVSEEVERNMMRTAGIVGGGGTGSSRFRSPGLPGLGDEEEKVDDDYEEQEPGQIAARVSKRQGGPNGVPGSRGRGAT